MDPSHEPPAVRTGLAGNARTWRGANRGPGPLGNRHADRTIRDIRELFGLGRTAVYELTHRPGFPEPIKLSPRCYRWWASEVLAFTADVRLRIRHPAEAARPGGRRIGGVTGRSGAAAYHRDDARRPQPEGIVTQRILQPAHAPHRLYSQHRQGGRVPAGIHNTGASQLAVTRRCTCAHRTVVWWWSWSAGSRCTRRGGRGTGGGRCGTRTGSGASARRRPRRSWPPSWRRSPSGWRPTRRTWSGPART